MVAGGTGAIGSKLIKVLESKHDVIVLSRSEDQILSKNIKIVNYSNDIEDWCETINKSDVVINLVGEGINNKRWSKKQKKIILDSRLNSIIKISKALQLINYKPKLIINASAIGYYAYSDKKQNEKSHKGDHFLSDICMHWENKAFEEFSSKSERVTVLRIGVVLDSNSGILSKLSCLFKTGFGAIIGNGKQSFSWIDIEDVVGAIIHIMKTDIYGPINLTSPANDTNYSFSKELGKIFNKPVILRVPKFCIKLFLGEMSQIATNSLNIYPKVLLETGYKFKFCSMNKSLKKNYKSE